MTHWSPLFVNSLTCILSLSRNGKHLEGWELILFLKLANKILRLLSQSHHYHVGSLTNWLLNSVSGVLVFLLKCRLCYGINYLIPTACPAYVSILIKLISGWTTQWQTDLILLQHFDANPVRAWIRIIDAHCGFNSLCFTNICWKSFTNLSSLVLEYAGFKPISNGIKNFLSLSFYGNKQVNGKTKKPMIPGLIRFLTVEKMKHHTY